MTEETLRDCELCNKNRLCLLVDSLGSYLCFDCRKTLMNPNTSALQWPSNAFRDPTDSVSLTKNTKGYNWEIKLQRIDLAELKRINAELLNEFGGG